MQAGALSELGCTNMTDPARSRKDSVDSCPLKINGCIQVGLAQYKRKELNKVVYFLRILLGSMAVLVGCSEGRGSVKGREGGEGAGRRVRGMITTMHTTGSHPTGTYP